MRRVGFDTETHLIARCRQAPPLVCVSWWSAGEGGVLSAADGLRRFEGWLRDLDVVLVAHNAAFDLSVMLAADFSLAPLVFRALDDGRIKDTLIREMLLTNAFGEMDRFSKVALEHENVGRFSLAGCVDRHLGEDISAGKAQDAWRLRYAELEDVPVSDWPQAAYDYALSDARYAVEVYQSQNQAGVVARKRIRESTANGLSSFWREFESVYANEDEQVRAAFALRLMECWGLRTDGPSVAALEGRIREELDALDPELISAGLKRPAGTVDLGALRARVEAAYSARGASSPRTEKNSTSTSKKTCIESGDDLLVRYGKASELRKILTTYVPALKRGVDGPLHPRFNPLVESGRTSAFDPNTQNPPRKGGVRECFVAREIGGEPWVYVSCDYDSAELRSLAQVCLDLVGSSRLAVRYQTDPEFDPHAAFAAMLMEKTYEDGLVLKEAGDPRFKELRQMAKAANFGFPGMLSANSFISYAEGYGVSVGRVEANRIRNGWFAQWPEMRRYFSIIDTLVGRGNPILQLRSNRVRGGVRKTSAANTFFQGLTADGCKRALYLVAQECYSVPSSPLYGARPCLFLHDEIIIEAPLRTAPEAAERLSEVMVEAMSEYLPDVPSTASPALMRRWYKDAEAVRDEAGRLLVWEPA